MARPASTPVVQRGRRRARRDGGPDAPTVGAVAPHDPSDIAPSLMSPLQPHVIVMFGATGDLARRKLLPGLLHLSRAGLLPECRIVGTSLDDIDTDHFRAIAKEACEEFAVG